MASNRSNESRVINADFLSCTGNFLAGTNASFGGDQL